MIETITTIITDMSTSIEINTTYDTSSKVRLQQMRMQKGTSQEMARVHHDNCLRGQIQASFCLNRIKQANRMGHFYWHNDRENTCEFQVTDRYSRHTSSDTAYLELLKQDPVVGGAFELTPYGMGAELDCLTTFMAASVKDRMVGKFVLFNSNNALPGPAPQQMLALPDKESDSYRLQYITEQERYAHRLQEQMLLEETGGATENQMLAIGWEATPPEIQGAPLITETADSQPAPKNARKPRKKTERKVAAEEKINLEDMQLGQAVPPVKKRGAKAAKVAKAPTPKKEKTARKNNQRESHSTKPMLSLVP
ncbi:MAG: hypothetical protein JST89_25880 [Cyanobacteria bacterium SZAS-4]|nr:hypothetical protein [Cyanobacteria bacterium SZAS-4]